MDTTNCMIGHCFLLFSKQSDRVTRASVGNLGSCRRVMGRGRRERWPRVGLGLLADHVDHWRSRSPRHICPPLSAHSLTISFLCTGKLTRCQAWKTGGTKLSGAIIATYLHGQVTFIRTLYIPNVAGWLLLTTNCMQ